MRRRYSRCASSSSLLPPPRPHAAPGDAERARARAFLAALNRATSARQPGAEAGTANRRFHLALIAPGGQALTVSIVERLQVLAERYVRKHLEIAGRGARARREHAALLAAWLKRDAGRVAELTRRHIQTTLGDLKKQLAAPPPSGDHAGKCRNRHADCEQPRKQKASRTSFRNR